MGEKSMKLNDYQKLCLRTLPPMTDRDVVINGALGLNGESGEVADVIKKYLFQGHEWNEAKLVEEIGDVLWYVATTLAGLQISLEDCARMNIQKLEKRYPDGFEPEKSKNRLN